MQEVITAICDPTRRAALAIVWDGGEHCVCELMARLGASQSRMSRHMKVLREASLGTDRRDAQRSGCAFAGTRISRPNWRL